MPKDTSTASTTPSKNISSTSGRPSTDSPRSSHRRVSPEETLEREYKKIDDINPGDVVSGPTPGLHEISKKIDFKYSSTGGARGSQFHKQIVLGKTGDGRLRTVMLTSFGSLKIGETIWDTWPKRKFTREEWGQNLEYYVPLEPGEVDPDYEKYKQPNVVIKYASSDDFESAQPSVAQWAFVAKQFIIRPLDGKDAGKYSVVKGVKVSDASVRELKELVDASQKRLKAAELDPAGESSSGNVKAEQEPAPKPLEKKSTMDKKSAMGKSWRREGESTQKPLHSGGGESTGTPQKATRSGDGKASPVSSNPSREIRTLAHRDGAQEEGLSRSFAEVAIAPPSKAPEKERSSGKKVLRLGSSKSSQPRSKGN